MDKDHHDANETMFAGSGHNTTDEADDHQRLRRYAAEVPTAAAAEEGGGGPHHETKSSWYDPLGFLSPDTSVCDWPPIGEEEAIGSVFVNGVRCNSDGYVDYIQLSKFLSFHVNWPVTLL